MWGNKRIYLSLVDGAYIHTVKSIQKRRETRRFHGIKNAEYSSRPGNDLTQNGRKHRPTKASNKLRRQDIQDNMEYDKIVEGLIHNKFLTCSSFGAESPLYLIHLASRDTLGGARPGFTAQSGLHHPDTVKDMEVESVWERLENHEGQRLTQRDCHIKLYFLH